MKKKITETISLKLRKNLLSSRIKTFLIMAILIAAFLVLSFFIKDKDLPKLDVTENKLYSLSEESINELKKIDNKVNIIVYGYDENSTLVDLLKQYNKNNPGIEYQIITNEDNPDYVTKYGFKTGDQTVVVESGDSNKVLSAYDFVSYDYNTNQQIDLTENALTNTILNLTIANKPKVYIVTGHNELPVEQYLTKILAYLQNEVFDYATLNLLTIETIPEDCDLLAIFSPQVDLIDSEVQILQQYINNGGNIILTSDLLNEENKNQPNWQSILDMYGLTIENGIVYETDSNSYVPNYPYIFFPKIENTEITSKIQSDGSILLEMPKRIITADETKQEELKVTYQELIKSSEKSYFITDFSQNALNSLAGQEPSSQLIAVKATKKIADTEKESNIIAIANGTFITNLESVVAQNYSQVNLYNNADFFVNSVANLTNRDDTITIRKEYNSSTFTPTEKQNIIVLIVIFIIPILIIIIGIIVWNYRKHKK